MGNSPKNKLENRKVVIVKSGKRLRISLLLTLIFGPFGLFYSTIIGGLIMSFLFSLMLLIAFIAADSSIAVAYAFLFYPISIIWGTNAVMKHNKSHTLAPKSKQNETF